MRDPIENVTRLQKQLNNLRDLERDVSSDVGPGCDLTGTVGGGKPGVDCLFGP